MTEEPMTAEEINNVILGCDIPEVAYGGPTESFNIDYQRECALRLAVDTFKGSGVSTHDILIRAQSFYNFMTGKAS